MDRASVEVEGVRIEPLGIGAAFSDVQRFHRTFDHPAPGQPFKQTNRAARQRGKWIKEEVKELGDAMTLVDQADAYLDIVYFAIGGLVELGVEPSRLWEIVHTANMAKVQPDGSVKRDPENGNKVVKPEGWEPPEPKLAAEIHRQVVEALNYAPVDHRNLADCVAKFSRCPPNYGADGRDLTIRELQTQLPWTIRYSQDFRASPMAHKDFAHTMHHVSKAAGKLHALADDMDHDRALADTPGLRDEHARFIADLVVCALRLANVFPGGVIDLQHAVEHRIEDKNGVALVRKRAPKK